MAGSPAGATILFLIARSAIGEPLARAQNPLIGSLAAGFRADAFNYILFLRLIPSPSWLTSAAAGSLRVRLSVFVGATALGRVPGSFVFALFGSGLGGLIGALAIQLVFEVCRTDGLAICTSCGTPYLPPKRRPRRDQNPYCTDCGISAARRDAAARYRLTEKYKEARCRRQMTNGARG